MFRQVANKGEVLDICLKVTEIKWEKRDFFLKLMNVRNIPSLTLPKDESLGFMRYSGEDIDHIISVFGTNFIYWEKYNLLAILGEVYPNEIKEMFSTSFYFQNSSDQDYEYSDWGYSIALFNDIVREHQDADITQIYKEVAAWRDESVDEVKEDVDNDPEYYRKSMTYDEIYRTLELDKWLYSRESDVFKRFCINPIDSQEREFEAYKSFASIYFKNK